MMPYSHAVTKNQCAAEPARDEQQQNGCKGEGEAGGNYAGPAIPRMNETVEEGEQHDDDVAYGMWPGRRASANLAARKEVHGTSHRGKGSDRQVPQTAAIRRSVSK